MRRPHRHYAAMQGPGMDGVADSGPMAPHRPPMEHAFRMGPRGRWWDNPDVAQKLGLSADQQKKMDDIFLQSRLKLIDEHASVEKEEAILEPLLSAEQPDESRILAQIDKVAQSRAELEKANARMLLGLRGVLTTAQWKTLQTLGQREACSTSGRRGTGWPARDRGAPGWQPTDRRCAAAGDSGSRRDAPNGAAGRQSQSTVRFGSCENVAFSRRSRHRGLRVLCCLSAAAGSR